MYTIMSVEEVHYMQMKKYVPLQGSLLAFPSLLIYLLFLSALYSLMYSRAYSLVPNQTSWR